MTLAENLGEREKLPQEELQKIVPPLFIETLERMKKIPELKEQLVSNFFDMKRTENSIEFIRNGCDCRVTLRRAPDMECLDIFRTSETRHEGILFQLRYEMLNEYESRFQYPKRRLLQDAVVLYQSLDLGDQSGKIIQSNNQEAINKASGFIEQF